MSEQAKQALDQHVRDIVQWHFSPDTGCPFWLDWAGTNAFDAVAEVQCFDDLSKLPRFEDQWLRRLPHEVWAPQPYRDRPFMIFETGGTTGMPKQRISWEDHLTDYTEFSNLLDALCPDAFPRRANWLSRLYRGRPRILSS